MYVKVLDNTTAIIKRSKGGGISRFPDIWQGVPFNFVQDYLDYLTYFVQVYREKLAIFFFLLKFSVILFILKKGLEAFGAIYEDFCQKFIIFGKQRR